MSKTKHSPPAGLCNRQQPALIVATMASYARAGVCFRIALFPVFVFFAALPARAQITFSAAIDLCLQNSLKIKSAEGDVKRAAAALAVTKDIFIPSVVTGAGVGTAYGITLNVPTIFTVNAQSLVYSAQQRFYIRAARSDFQSARQALADARSQVEEDTAITYLSFDHDQKAMATVSEQYDFAVKLVSIVQDRVGGKLDSDLELIKARRTAVQLKLQKIRAENDVAALQDHLAQLTGLAADRLSAVPDSIPKMAMPSSDGSLRLEFTASPAVLSAEANAQAKRQRAEGDSHYTWRPQVTFGGQYGRISPVENVSTFYNIQGNYNSASIGVQIQLPMFDRVRKAAAQESTLDALRAENDLQALHVDEAQGRNKLLRSLPELEATAELAGLEQEIAQNELNSTLIQLKQSGAGPVVTPKEEMNARIQERQKYLDLLDAKLQLQKAQISLLRQTGQLDKWLQSATLPSAPAP